MKQGSYSQEKSRGKEILWKVEGNEEQSGKTRERFCCLQNFLILTQAWEFLKISEFPESCTCVKPKRMHFNFNTLI